ncbi:hypothetical protein DQF47_15445 [Escherichia coli]|nr:hypothetical protein [Escherichia coli]
MTDLLYFILFHWYFLTLKKSALRKCPYINNEFGQPIFLTCITNLNRCITSAIFYCTNVIDICRLKSVPGMSLISRLAQSGR